jgi:hypothetical protein
MVPVIHAAQTQQVSDLEVVIHSSTLYYAFTDVITPNLGSHAEEKGTPKGKSLAGRETINSDSEYSSQ